MQPATLEKEDALFRNRPFMLLWAAQALTQTAQNGIFFVLMVFITETTGSTTHLSILVFSTILPSLLFGLTAGVVVDRQRKRTVLLITNILRAVLVVGYLPLGHGLAFMYLVNFLFSSVSQFFGPAEASSIPLLVPKRQLMKANSFFNLTFTGSQFAGLVFPVPVMVKLFGTTWVLVGIGIIYLIAVVLVALLPQSERQPSGQSNARGFLSGLGEELRQGWQLIRSRPIISLSMFHLTTATTFILVLSVVAAPFVKVVLGIRADDAVYILAPAGLGVLAGTILSPRLASRIPRLTVVNLSLVAMALCLLVFSAVNWVGHQLGMGLPEWAVVQWVLGMVMVLALFMGLEFALITITAQTILQEHSPPSMRGKVFATQLTLGNVASIIPIVFVGGLADIFGIAQVIGLVGLAVLSIGVFSLRRSRAVLKAEAQAA